jgi:CDP-diacylglycerol--glycerol-3-phosphate 3-phosphatidyltransferase
LGRLIAIPIVIILLSLEIQSPMIAAAAAIVYLLASLSDLLDGYLARKYGNESNLGRFLDPMADKLLVFSALILLVGLQRAPAWVAFLIVSREMAVTSLRAIAVEQGLVIAASAQGKQKTLIQNIAMFCLLWRYDLFWLSAHKVGLFMLYLALITTYWSGGLYFYHFFKAGRRKAPKTPENHS